MEHRVEVFRDTVLRPVLRSMNLASHSAELLLLGTIAQESNFKYVEQLGGGPGLGLYQMEPATHADIWMNWLVHRRMWLERVQRWGNLEWPSAKDLMWNHAYATAMARIHYYRVKEPLPEATPIALGAYWKRHYNTHLGAGTISQFVANYEKFVA